VFSKAEKTFITSMHLNSKELNLKYDLFLPSRAPFWVGQ
jgi:hypothetical protein